MKTKITLHVDADVLREARKLAAAKGLSVSALLAVELNAIVRQRKGYDRARKRTVARLRNGLDLGWTRPDSRDDLHMRLAVHNQPPPIGQLSDSPSRKSTGRGAFSAGQYWFCTISVPRPPVCPAVFQLLEC
jgi:hypothetical protein